MTDLQNQPFALGPDDVEVLGRQDLYRGFFRMEGVRLRHRRFDGGWTDVFNRELLLRGDSTCVLPYDPWRDEVVLLEQFRPGALGRDRTPWLLELVAGMNEPGEDPRDVAHREGQEEAGLAFMALEEICRYLPSPGGTTEYITLFCGCVRTDGVGGVHGLAEEHEDIQVHVYGFDQALSLLGEGRIDNAASIIGLQWLALNHAEIRDRWRGLTS